MTVADVDASTPPSEAEPLQSAAAAVEAGEEPRSGESAPEKAPEASAKTPRKARKGKARAVDEAPAEGPSVAAHPRAARAIARAKGWGALGGFLLGGYLSLPTHTLASAGLRAIIAGTVCYVAVWAGAVFFWRRMVVLEIKAREQELVRAVQDDAARRDAAAAQGAKAAARAQGAAQLSKENRPPLR